jgi:hypothetical protein
MTNSKIKINLDSLKSRREWKRHKVKDGHNIFRILPPFGDSSNGYPYRKWQIIWGLKDPESGRVRPFASSMTSEKKCPVTEYVAALKKKADTLKAKMQASGTGEDEIRTTLKDLNELISNLSPKTVYLYNAADKAGEVGLLELKSTAHKKMKDQMGQYVHDYNQDPTSLNSFDDDGGVWFDVTRQGLGRDTEYDVKKCQIRTKNAQGKITFEDDRSPLPDSVVQNYDNLAYDLSAVYQLKSYDELKEILDANISDIEGAVPLAVLDNSDVPVATQTRKPTGSKPVTTRFDSEDDEQDNSPTTSKSLVEDDFLAEADAILKG